MTLNEKRTCYGSTQNNKESWPGALAERVRSLGREHLPSTEQGDLEPNGWCQAQGDLEPNGWCQAWNLLNGAKHRETWYLLDGAEHKKT